MRYFLRVANVAQPEQLWRIEAREAVRLGVSNAVGGPGSHVAAAGDETIWQAFERQTGWLVADLPATNPFHELELAPRRYYPRC